ncbi:hypothetical protein BDW62DRAFT_202747 [Aspergillus aurantiobrunneus]
MAKAPSPLAKVLGLCLLAILLGVTIGESIPSTTPGQLRPPPGASPKQCSRDCASCARRPPEEKSLAKRVFENPWDPRFGNTINYVAYAISMAEQVQIYPMDGMSYSIARAEALQNVPFKLVIGHLQGCVVVVIVSRWGLYMSHHWEVPSLSRGNWLPADETIFKEQVLDELRFGGGQDMPNLPQFIYEDGPFAAQYHPKAYVFMRRATSRPNYDRLYQDKVIKIADTVAKITGLETSIDAYDNSWNESPDDPDPSSIVRGKIVFEYDPDGLGDICKAAMSRLWVEDKIAYHDEWAPLESQTGQNSDAGDLGSDGMDLDSNS